MFKTEAGLTLNKEKCVFSQDQITFVGHRVGKNGIIADPGKMDALRNMKKPSNVSEVRRFLGMANKFNDTVSWQTSLMTL